MHGFYKELEDFQSALRMCDVMDKLPLTNEDSKACVQELREDTIIKQILHDAEGLLETDREKSIGLFRKAWDHYNEVFPVFKKGPTGGRIIDRSLNRLITLQHEGKVPQFDFKKKP